MRFTQQTLLAVLAQAFVVFGQDNSFNVPSGGYNATAGQSLTLNWTPTTSGNVDLILRSGASNDLSSGAYIAQNIANSGSYTWSIPSDVTRGSDYAVEIVDVANTTNVNYTPYFVIDSTNTIATTTGQVTLGASASVTPSSSASVLTGSATGSSVSSEISSANSAISSASASASSVVASESSKVAASSSKTGSTASSAASSASSKATSAASSASSATSSAASSATGGAAAMATAFPGLMALGALALAL